MKKIKIKFCDFSPSHKLEEFYIYQLLIKKYDIELSDNPDYIIYSTFGYENLKYDGIRIFFTGENIRPNFNHCDYAIGFDYITFEDRYIRFPLYLAYDKYLDNLKLAEKKHQNKENFKIKNKFCNMVVSNGLSKQRIIFFKELSNYKQVDSGGKLLNNVGGPVDSKLDFQKNYKFSLAFENSASNGYTTEKLIDAFASGGIPIYWGDPKVSNVFNSKSFIDATQFSTFKELIDFIKTIDNDDELYLQYIKTPAFNDKDYIKKEQKNIQEFIFKIFDQDFNNAKRRCNSHFVLQEKKYYLLADSLVKKAKPLLRFKTKIKNKLVK